MTAELVKNLDAIKPDKVPICKSCHYWIPHNQTGILHCVAQLYRGGTRQFCNYYEREPGSDDV